MMINPQKFYLTWLYLLFFLASCGGGSGVSIVYLPPVFINDYSEITSLEGSKDIVTIIAVDTNNRPVMHSIVGGSDEELFIMSSNGVLKFLTQPNYEAPLDLDANNIYHISIEAAAGNNITSLDVSISVKDAFEGRVVDGPLVGALIFIDTNDNFILDSNEKSTTSDSEGFFYINKESLACDAACNQNVIAQAGFDSQSNRTSKLFLVAPLDINKIINVSPLSTLIQASSDYASLLKALNISQTKNDILTKDIWSLAKEGESASKSLMRVNLQIGMILTAAQNLLSSKPDLDVIQFRSLASNRLVSIINTKQNAIYKKVALNEYFTSIAAEIGSDLNFDSIFIESLAKSLADINALLEDKSSNPTNDAISEILSVTQTAINNSIDRTLEGRFTYNQFIEATSISVMFANSVLIKNLNDADEDGLADIIDLNDDNDAIDDLDDVFPFDKNETVDTDIDGVGNNADADDDGDGVNDTSDAYPLNKNVHTAPTAIASSWNLNLLPKSQNTGNGELSGTAQDNRSLTYTLVSNATNGVATITDSSKGEFTYQTLSGVAASTVDSFTFKVNDGFVSSTISKVTVSLQTDPLYEHQWHLNNIGQLNFASTAAEASKDINIDSVINSGYTGKGVKVAIVDSGLEITHEDLKENIIAEGSFNFLNNSTDPTSVSTDGDHGTSVAGVIGARGWNNIGGRGVAPKASLKGFNLLKAGTNANVISSLGGASYSNNIDVFNLSYGFDATTSFVINPAIKAQYIDGVTNLRSGKGAIYVASAGNGFTSFGSAECSDANSNGLSCNNISMDPEHSIPYVILVGALNANGTHASYSSSGSGLWISAPAGENGRDISIIGTGYGPYTPAIMTTDQSTCDKGYVRSNLVSYANAFENKGNHSSNTICNYTSTFTGTSAAAPVVTGSIAILLEANPNLTWRDIKHILASSAVQVDPTIEATVFDDYIAESSWTTNSAGYKFHNYYGFGGIDVSAALILAKNYTLGSLGAFITSNERSSITLNASIPDNSNTGIATVITDSNNLTIEAINVNLCLSHDRPSDLGVALTSPGGTRSVLLSPFNGFSNTDSCFNILSNAFYGENSTGNWTIKIHDKKSGTSGSLSNWKLTVFGR